MKHFDENMNDEMRDVRNSNITLRSSQLHTLVKESDDTALNYLFITNAGSAILTFVYLGVMFGSGAAPLFLKIALSLFFIGLIFVGLYKAYTIEYYEDLFEHYQKLTESYYHQNIGWIEMNQSDIDKAGNSMIPYVLGYGAFLSFIIGCIFAGIAIF